MNYFMGTILEGRITGVEKAQINRLKLFLENNEDAYCVYSAWNPYTYRNAIQFGVEENVFTLYDYFQESNKYVNNVKFDWINFWESEHNYTLKYVQNSNDLKIYENGRYRMYVHFNDKYYSDIGYINYFDNNQRKIKREIFDTRGFLNCSRILGHNQKIVMENYYNPKGQIRIQKFYDVEYVGNDNRLTRIVIKTDNGDVFLSSEDELIEYFYKTLFKQGDIFYIDRPYELGKIVEKIENKIPFYVILHSTHLYNGVIKSIYESIFNHLENYKGIIVSTMKQKEDLSQLIDNKIPVYNISVGYTEKVSESLINKNFEKPQLISLSRLVPSKQVEQQIEVIKKVKEVIPNIQLNIYGHGGSLQKLLELVKKYNLEKNIHLRGFSNEIEKELKRASLKIFTSKMEGFALSILESLTVGTPVISYDIKYGPNEMIESGVNGYLIEEGNINSMAETIIMVLNNSDHLKELSQNSLTSANRYLGFNVFDKWKSVIKSSY
ncbi:glycosyltransferase [Staphylococcus croceilyticus]|uniref:Glycosyltransferase n=2 Tax=Staphylococcus croceilyticus TaxID=319942 RepID=A0ABY2KEE1_9STAP|nr:glycosyltransferase [Staphylococcus croceilyticus]TGA73519.1 glycosyltransferase [Staphylococcus croceilyticus]